MTLVTSRYKNYFRDRKVIWIQDNLASQGKSTFIKYLAMNEKLFDLGLEKLPIDRPERIRSAVIKLLDIYICAFTCTQGVDTNFQNLLEVIEEIKNSYIVFS